MKSKSLKKAQRRTVASPGPRFLRRSSAFMFVACLGIWLPKTYGAKLIDLDATQLSVGPLTNWTNTGSVAGDFVSSGDVVPSVNTVDGAKAVQFVGGTGGGVGTHYLGPITPPAVTGNGNRTVEAWVWDATMDSLPEKAVLGWGRRGADALNNSFGHGTDPTFGAVGHWGADDTGYNGQVVFDRWTYVVYSFNSTNNTDYVYVDGQLANIHTLPLPLNTASVDTGGNPLHFRVARQNTGAGAASGVGVGTIAIAKIRVHDTVMDLAAVRAQLSQEKSQFWQDTDGDGLPDWYEALYPGTLNSTNPNDAALDPDSDGLTNLQEFFNGTDPTKADTDGDGLTDSQEVNRMVNGQPAPTDPLKADTDGDGLSDKVETGTGVFVSANDTGSDPLKADTDGDGFSDSREVLDGTNPNDPLSFPGPNSPPLVSLDATSLAPGVLNVWTNTGALGGTFAPAADGVAQPANVEAVGGVNGLTLDGIATYYRGPVVPTILTGNPDVTIDAWVFNPDGQDEESVIAWGRRGGPDGTEFSFNHGTNATWGATTHWGGYDVGWNGHYATNRWTYIATTYNSSNHITKVYMDGKLANTFQEPGALGVFAVDTTSNPLPFTLGAQNIADGSASPGQLASLTVAKLRIYDRVSDDAFVQTTFDNEKAQFWSDADNDGLPDWYENLYPGTLNRSDPTDATKDPDNDGLTNLQEFAKGTDPSNPDTDGDGLKDGVETNTGIWVSATDTGTDPLKADTDGDGLNDGVETHTGVFVSASNTGTDPNKPDTDGDMFKDGQEVFLGSDPNDAASVPGSNPIVNLDATSLPEGTLDVWTNTGTLGGVFNAGDPADPAALSGSVETIQGAKGVTFDGTSNYYTGPAMPGALAGNADHAIEAWVLNPDISDEECVFAWGRRGGPDGTNVSFGHGANAAYGAVGHWGSYDVGWNGQLVSNKWTFISYVYTASNHVTKVFADGAVANTVTEPGALNTFGVDTAGNPLPLRVGNQSNADGTPDDARRASMTIARIKVFAVALDDARIAADYNAEKSTFLPAQPVIQNPAFNAGAFGFSWNSAPGASYAVDVSTNLPSWSTLATGLQTNRFTEIPPAGPMRFYRLRVE